MEALLVVPVVNLKKQLEIKPMTCHSFGDISKDGGYAQSFPRRKSLMAASRVDLVCWNSIITAEEVQLRCVLDGSNKAGG